MSQTALDTTPSEIDEGPAPDAVTPQPNRARWALLRRLADVVCLPVSRVNAFERSMTGDLMVEILKEASLEERQRVAARMANLTEIPALILRLLLRDDVEVSRVLLRDCPHLGDCDLVDCVRSGSVEHRQAVAVRKPLSQVVAEALVESGEPVVMEAVLKNDQASLSAATMEALTVATRDIPRLAPLLLRRPELRPSHAYALFWWADADGRRTILQRFAVSREVLQDACSDIFQKAAEENWQDPFTRKTLQFIERRQRNRAAIERSPFASLEEAVTAAQDGLTRELIEEIAYLSGLKPLTGAKIVSDAGGEPIAILCKATGLPKMAIRALWRGLKRPDTDSNGNLTPTLERAMTTFDSIAVDRAQTVLRYWNWSLSSAMTPALINAIRDGEEGALDEYSTPQRIAMLALGPDLRRGGAS